ncbi:SDR family oxidoreductase [Acidicapsa ligni]|uniref:SDR family oxidoreductase n=1 Tax=Acidicapsa ligni TaxID=542300 RepID=UPI0021E031BA|nr:SDR family oxidoreductase [Acidicapsa ligni]
MSEKNVVVIAGVHGVSGRAAAERWNAFPNTEVYGLSRRTAPVSEGVRSVAVDLLDAEDVREKLTSIPGVTHIVFGAYIEKATAAERSEVNVAILKNLLDVVEVTSPALRHVTFYQGGKAYGADLGPFKTPAREDDPRLMPPNFYYDQENFLRARQHGKHWSWSALRPEAICGYAIGNPMNLAMVIAVYAMISKELRLPLRFPGTERAYRALYQVTSADILADASIWAGTADAAKNSIFNITNGDYFRWQHMWPRIARMFDMEVADPIPMPLKVYMADKAPLWEAIVKKHNLQQIPYDAIASWEFGDFIFNTEFDNISSTIKARRAGFHGCIDTEDMFRQFFRKLSELRVGTTK